MNFIIKFFLCSCAAATAVVVGTLLPCGAQDNVAKSEIRLPINLVADQRVELRARVEGYVAQVRVDIGDRVEEGQLLITLDAPELKTDVRRREQMILQAEASLGVAQGAVATAEAKFRQTEASRAEQAALRKMRISERDRYDALVRGGAVQREKFEEAEFAVMAVEAAMAKIEADVQAAQADIAAARNEAEFAKSGIEVSKAEWEQANSLYDLTQLKAPFSGIVTDRRVDPGQLVTPNETSGTPLLVLEKVNVLRGVMTVPSDEAMQIKVGDPVSLIGFGDRQATAPNGGPLTVSRLSQSLDMKTRTMRVEFDLKNTFDEKNGRYPMLNGQYGSASVKIGK